MTELSLLSRYDQVEELISVLKGYASALEHHVIILPQDTLENAIRAGLPVDVVMTYRNVYLQPAVDDVRYIIWSINSVAIPRLENIKSDIMKSITAMNTTL